MATITRTLQFLGSVMSSPVAATVLLNGVEVYSGQIGVGQPIDVPGIELLTLEYQGDDISDEILSLSFSITSGASKLGPVNVLNQAGEWIHPNGNGNDGRTQILISGLAPEWPATPVTPMPSGTPENPNWSGWCFDVAAGETMTYEYTAIAFLPPPPPTA